MVFFTYSGAVTLNVQWCLLNLCSFQCLPIRSVINTHSYCCSTESLVVLAEKRQLYQKPQVPSWLPISLHLWFWRCEAARPGQNPHLLEREPFWDPALCPQACWLNENVPSEEPCSFWRSSCLCSSWALLYFLPRQILQSWEAEKGKKPCFPFLNWSY